MLPLLLALLACGNDRKAASDDGDNGFFDPGDTGDTGDTAGW